MREGGDVLIGGIAENGIEEYIKLEGITLTSNIVFWLGGPDKLIFSWDDGIFKVEYPEGKLDQAGKTFVAWLLQYMNKSQFCREQLSKTSTLRK
jgi:hypothetical protein